MIFALDTATAQAAAEPGLDCGDGACVLRMDMGDERLVTWHIAQENLSFLPGGGLQFLNEAAIQSPWGEIRLLDVEMRLEVDDAYRIASARGAALVEFPAIGDFTLFRSMLPIKAAIGYDRVANLPAAHAGLPDDQPYLYFDLEAGRALGPLAQPQQGSGLALAPGQRALVLLDPDTGRLFIDGQVMLYSYGQGALIDHLLSGELDSFEWSLDALPLRQVLIVHVQGASDTQTGPAFLRTGGDYSLDGGALGEWLSLSDTMLLIGGDLTLGTEGVALAGRASAALVPAYLLTTQAQAQLALHFGENWRTSGLSFAVGAELPWVGVGGDLAASVNAGLGVQGAATLAHNWGETPIVYAVAGATDPAQVWQGTQKNWQNMTNYIASSYNNASQTAGAYWPRWETEPYTDWAYSQWNHVQTQWAWSVGTGEPDAIQPEEMSHAPVQVAAASASPVAASE